MSEHLPGEAGIAQADLVLPTEQPNLIQDQMPVEGSRLFDRMRNKWAVIAATGTAGLALLVSPLPKERPAYAVDAETAVVGMPFEGEWAYNILTTAACGSGSGQTSHPSCHDIYSGDWSTDLYAAAGTDVKLNIGEATGALSLAWDTATGSCGETRRVKISVDNVYIGRVSFTHLTESASTDTAPTNGMTIGKIANLTCNPGGPNKKHVHMEVDNSSTTTYACYKNHSTEAHTAGQSLTAGTNLGTVGSPNTGTKEVCSTESTTPPDTDQDGIPNTQDSCPTVAGTAAHNGCPPPIAKTTTLGVYDPNGAVFHLRDSNTAGPAGVSVQFGNANWEPLSGDWDGNGTFTPGAYDPATGMFYLRDSHTPGAADRAFQYGNIGWKPIVGDWDGNGYSSVGLYDPATSTFYLKNFNGPGAADHTIQYGNANWIPLAGDWDGELDGNHQTTIGVYDPATATFHLNNQLDSSAAESSFQYGNVGWTPISGDWDGNRFHSIGMYDPATSTYYLRNLNSGGAADITVQYGNGGMGWKPVMGDWNGGA